MTKRPVRAEFASRDVCIFFRATDEEDAVLQ